jgi:hypothetical protein
VSREEEFELPDVILGRMRVLNEEIRKEIAELQDMLA